MIDARDELKRGMLWLGSATAVTRVLDFGASVVVIALLTRAEMGQAALALGVVAVLEAASGLGLGYALIQAPDVSADEESSLFWLTSGIGLALGGVAAAASVLMARAYDEPLLGPLVAASAVKLLLVGIAVVPLQLLSKRLLFREAGTVQTLATAVAGLTKVSLAVAGAGAWAMVLSEVARGAALVVLLALLSGFRPRLHFAAAETRRFLSVGIRVVLSGGLGQLYRNADYFLVGKLLGMEALGLYRVAFDIAMQPTEAMIAVINRVGYPIYAKVASDARALTGAVLDSTRSMTLLGAPAVAFVFFAASDVLHLVAGDKWAGSVPAVQLLVGAGLLRALALIFPQVYVAAGRAQYAVLDSALTLVVLASSFWLGLTLLPELGVLSVCYAWLAVYPVILAFHVWLSRPIVPLGVGRYLRTLLPGLGGGVAVAVGMGLVTLLGVSQTSRAASLALLGAGALAVYFAYCRVVLRIRLSDLSPRRRAAVVTGDGPSPQASSDAPGG